MKVSTVKIIRQLAWKLDSDVSSFYNRALNFEKNGEKLAEKHTNTEISCEIAQTVLTLTKLFAFTSYLLILSNELMEEKKVFRAFLKIVDPLPKIPCR